MHDRGIKSFSRRNSWRCCRSYSKDLPVHGNHHSLSRRKKWHGLCLQQKSRLVKLCNHWTMLERSLQQVRASTKPSGIPSGRVTQRPCGLRSSDGFKRQISKGDAHGREPRCKEIGDAHGGERQCEGSRIILRNEAACKRRRVAAKDEHVDNIREQPQDVFVLSKSYLV